VRDPIRALERVRSVCAGELLLVDNFDPLLSALHPRRPVAGFDGLGRPWWWRPNAAGLVRTVESAGFEVLGRPVRSTLEAGRGQRRPPLRPSVLRSRAARVDLGSVVAGDPHLAVRARPRTP